MSYIDAALIQAVLRAHGVQFLAASDDQDDDAAGGQIVAFLDGNAGADQQQIAIDVLRHLDGVQSVDVSQASWTILIVRFRSDPAEQG